MKYRCKENVFVTELADRLALLDMETGTYFSLNQAGAFIWRKISENLSLNAIVDALCEEYEVGRDVALHDCERLIDDLLSQGILTLDDASIAR